MCLYFYMLTHIIIYTCINSESRVFVSCTRVSNTHIRVYEDTVLYAKPMSSGDIIVRFDGFFSKIFLPFLRVRMVVYTVAVVVVVVV